MKWDTPIPQGDFMQNNNCCCNGSNGSNMITRLIYVTGPQGPAGATGTLEASTNRNDTTQTVTNDSVVSITGTNVLTNDADMLFVNNTVRINSTGLYLITTTIEASGNAGSYTLALRVNDTDYNFVLTINNEASIGTTSHTIYLNIGTSPTVVSIYNRSDTTLTIQRAELDVVKLT